MIHQEGEQKEDAG